LDSVARSFAVAPENVADRSSIPSASLTYNPRKEGSEFTVLVARLLLMTTSSTCQISTPTPGPVGAVRNLSNSHEPSVCLFSTRKYCVGSAEVLENILSASGFASTGCRLLALVTVTRVGTSHPRVIFDHADRCVGVSGLSRKLLPQRPNPMRSKTPTPEKFPPTCPKGEVGYRSGNPNRCPIS
jgi:hypothetical protein